MKRFNYKVILGNILLLFLFSMTTTAKKTWDKKPRVIVMTDIGNEPDDAMSMVRFLVYVNEFDVEGLISTTSVHLKKKSLIEKIQERIVAYGVVRDNLLKHATGYPTKEALLAVTKKGIEEFGMEGVGEGKDSEGSEWMINVLDKPDHRPIWALAWGGTNCLAQALWKYRKTHSSMEMEVAIGKLRVYTISDQDDAGMWLRKTFPQLFYIVSPGTHKNGAYKMATWSGISGERFYKFNTGADSSIVGNPWLRQNVILNHGPLGELYPEVKFIMEGDTPSFLGLIGNGLNVPEHPEYGGWGGRYALKLPPHTEWREDEAHQIYTDSNDSVTGSDGQLYFDNHATIWRWRADFQNDFASRMDWCIQPFNKANHPPIALVKVILPKQFKDGRRIIVDAGKSTDPDGNKLRYYWLFYKEAGTFGGKLLIHNPGNQATAISVVAPNGESGEAHIILKVSDDGNPSLTRYKRLIIPIK